MNERELTAGMSSAIQADVVHPIVLMEGEFATGTARFWTGFGTVPWNGHDWIGLGDLVGLSPIGESTEISAKGFSVMLSGQNPATLALALGACRQGARGRFWLGALDADGHIIADPYLVREGLLDVPVGADDGDTATITINYEDRLVDLERAREFRYTTESQRLFYPDDKGFDFVTSLQDAQDVWMP